PQGQGKEAAPLTGNMLVHYLVLGLPPSATGEQIRRRYLELVRAHRPSEDPERFQQITAACEALKVESRGGA
ncbi:MAG: J domain-containing protein, partial [Gammaproteobacteria bacterium]|nr:J domain-containing protein [Gammaproteobacteria bacterium]